MDEGGDPIEFENWLRKVDKYVKSKDVIEHPSLYDIRLEWQAKKEKEAFEQLQLELSKKDQSSTSLLSSSMHSNTSTKSKKAAGRQKSFKELQAEKNRKSKENVLDPLQFIIPEEKQKAVTKKLGSNGKPIPEGSYAFLSPYRDPFESHISSPYNRAAINRRKKEYHDNRSSGIFSKSGNQSPHAPRLNPLSFNTNDGISENGDNSGRSKDYGTRKQSIFASTEAPLQQQHSSSNISRSSISLAIERDFESSGPVRGFQVKDYTMDAFRYRPPIPNSHCISYEVDMDDLPHANDGDKNNEEIDLVALAASNPAAAAAALAAIELKNQQEKERSHGADINIFEVNKSNYAFTDRAAFNNIHYHKLTLPSLSSKHSPHTSASPSRSQSQHPRPNSAALSGRVDLPSSREPPSPLSFFDHPTTARLLEASSQEMDIERLHVDEKTNLKLAIRDWYQRNDVFAPKRYNRKKDGIYVKKCHSTNSIALNGLLLESNPYNADDLIIKKNLDRETNEMEV